MANWQLDPYHTQVEFSAKHLGMMTVRGYFDEVSATAEIDPDRPEAASVEVAPEARSDDRGADHSRTEPANQMPSGARPGVPT